MTLCELSLYVEGYARRVHRESEQSVTTSWLMARLNRAKRIPSLARLLRFRDKPRVLPPEEAAQELARHEELVEKLAPEATATEEQLREFSERQNREWEERRRASTIDPPEE